MYLFVYWLQRWADTNVTLAFEDVQVIPPFSREECHDTDDTDATDAIDATDDTDETDYTDDSDDKVDGMMAGNGWKRLEWL